MNETLCTKSSRRKEKNRLRYQNKNFTGGGVRGVTIRSEEWRRASDARVRNVIGISGDGVVVGSSLVLFPVSIQTESGPFKHFNLSSKIEFRFVRHRPGTNQWWHVKTYHVDQLDHPFFVPGTSCGRSFPPVGFGPVLGHESRRRRLPTSCLGGFYS